MGLSILIVFLVACTVMAVLPWVKDRLAFRKVGATVAVTMQEEHGLKPGDDVMILKRDGMPVAGYTWYRVVLTPTPCTLMLRHHEVQVQD